MQELDGGGGRGPAARRSEEQGGRKNLPAYEAGSDNVKSAAAFGRGRGCPYQAGYEYQAGGPLN